MAYKVSTTTYPCSFRYWQCPVVHLPDELAAEHSVGFLPFVHLTDLPSKNELVALEAEVNILLVDLR